MPFPSARRSSERAKQRAIRSARRGASRRKKKHTAALRKKSVGRRKSFASTSPKREQLRLHVTMFGGEDDYYQTFRSCFRVSNDVDVTVVTDYNEYKDKMCAFPLQLYRMHSDGLTHAMTMEVCREYIRGEYDGRLSFLELRSGDGTVVQATLGSNTDSGETWTFQGIVKDPESSYKGVGRNLLEQLRNIFHAKIRVTPHPDNERWIETLHNFRRDYPKFITVHAAR